MKSKLLDEVDANMRRQGMAKSTRKTYRTHLESLLKWAGAESTDFHEYIKQYWRKNVYPLSGQSDFSQFWIKSTPRRSAPRA